MYSGSECNLNLALRDMVKRSGGTFQVLKKKKKKDNQNKGMGMATQVDQGYMLENNRSDPGIGGSSYSPIRNMALPYLTFLVP